MVLFQHRDSTICKILSNLILLVPSDDSFTSSIVYCNLEPFASKSWLVADFRLSTANSVSPSPPPRLGLVLVQAWLQREAVQGWTLSRF